SFRARRGGERARVTEIRLVLREEGGGVEIARDLHLRPFALGHLIEDRLETGVVGSGTEKDADDRERARSRLVYEMNLHLERPAVEKVLARMVEMELDEIILRAGNGAGTAGIGVDLDGMAIVDEAQRKPAIVEPDAARVARQRSRQIDRRLLQAELADFEVRRELAPMLGSGLSLVGPMRLGVAIRRRMRRDVLSRSIADKS